MFGVYKVVGKVGRIPIKIANIVTDSLMILDGN